MLIREYTTSDCGRLAELFYKTVHSVNAKDYTKEQLIVWAAGDIDLSVWDKSLHTHLLRQNLFLKAVGTG